MGSLVVPNRSRFFHECKLEVHMRKCFGTCKIILIKYLDDGLLLGVFGLLCFLRCWRCWAVVLLRCCFCWAVWSVV